jgi:hypothetical protein
VAAQFSLRGHRAPFTLQRMDTGYSKLETENRPYDLKL